jgi:hypothetical protein
LACLADSQLLVFSCDFTTYYISDLDGRKAAPRSVCGHRGLAIERSENGWALVSGWDFSQHFFRMGVLIGVAGRLQS